MRGSQRLYFSSPCKWQALIGRKSCWKVDETSHTDYRSNTPKLIYLRTFFMHYGHMTLTWLKIIEYIGVVLPFCMSKQLPSLHKQHSSVTVVVWLPSDYSHAWVFMYDSWFCISLSKAIPKPSVWVWLIKYNYNNNRLWTVKLLGQVSFASILWL